MFSISKIPLWEGHFGGLPLSPEAPNLIPWRTPKFGPNNCLTNNFLHYEIQLSMLSSSKVLFWGGVAPRGPQIWFPERPLNLVKTIVSQTTSYVVTFNFLCSALQKFHYGKLFWGGLPSPWEAQEDPQIWLKQQNIYLSIIFNEKLDNQIA